VVKLPLLPSGPGGVRLPPVHSPWRNPHYQMEKSTAQPEKLHQCSCNRGHAE
jgi:hypothetical protein